MNSKPGYLGGLALLCALVAPAPDAVAASMQQAMAQCQAKYGPSIRECVGAKRRANPGTSIEQHLPGCRAPVMGQIKACVAGLIGAGALQNNPLDAAKAAPPAAAQQGINLAQKRNVAPKSIADITAILDQEKPDPVRLKKLQTAADASPPGGDSMAAAQFYNGRGLVRAELGRFQDALADAERSVKIATGKADQLVLSSFRQTAALLQTATGQPKAALAVVLKMADDGERANDRGWLFSAYRQIVGIYITLGDLDKAQAYVQKLQALWNGIGSIRGADSHRQTWEANVEDARAQLAEVRGRLDEAMRAYQRGEQLRRAGMDKSTRAVIAVPRARLEEGADVVLLSVGRVKSRMGRYAEGEADARRALLNRLKATGKYNPNTARFIAAFGSLMIEQGRYPDAKKLLAATIGIYRELGVAEDSQTFISAMSNLASVEALQRQWTDAAKSYAAVEKATQSWEASRREGVLLSHGYIETLYKTGRAEAGLAAAKRLFEIKNTLFGDKHADTALAQGHYAIGLARTKRDAEALKEFRAAIPMITAASFETDNDDVVNAAARTRYTQVVVETYIDLLSRVGEAAGIDVATESFRLADSIRSHAVQKALTASGARMNTSDPALAAALRQEQDLRLQIGTQLGQLNNLLALPAAQRDEAGVADLRRQIDKMRADHVRVRADIDRRFPDYADLIDPKPPAPDQIKPILKAGEALISFYFGHEASFVWAVPKEGAVKFATLAESAEAIEAKITKLREALEPQATMISDIPPFDLALSHELYKALLEPVKAGWADAKSLIVVTNGALGLLPLGVLTVVPHQLAGDDPLFGPYRAAPWLSRTHAVTMVPSASALRTLRRLQPGSPKRDKLIAFGDPWFNTDQANEKPDAPIQVAEAVQMRGIPLRRRSAPTTDGADSAVLGQLPRLPDTADELRSIALALEADPTKSLFLGKAANEQAVKKMDLSGFKIVAFATHGLVPGEIDGLDQPALALSAPGVAGVEGDGLLTMSEILSLKLDADWVVLSACNTGTGAGAGAEAASGLGRAFFYAGTRAILVTNWSVHSQSARELVTDLFGRQAADPKLSRAEALRQATMALADGKGFTNDRGATIFAYAHPLFWAPYTIIGDGG